MPEGPARAVHNGTPMPFRFVDPADLPADPMAAESALLERAAAGEAVAHLWEAPVSLAVPRSYRRHAALEAARARFAAEGCPVHLRLSGGGLVPQGPGILNLSLAWMETGLAGERAEPIYLWLCGLLRAALADAGVATHWQAVEGSFCDGRFNLAWGEGEAARKIVGTAQYWRPIAGSTPRRHAVLAHAVLLVDADTREANARANAFEAAIGSGRRYREDRIVSVAEARRRSGLPAGEPCGPGFSRALRERVRAAPAP
jgi:lipoate-protein ligase A